MEPWVELFTVHHMFQSVSIYHFGWELRAIRIIVCSCHHEVTGRGHIPMNIFRTLPSQYWAVCFAAGDLLADVHVRRDVYNLDPKPQPLPIGQAQQLTLCLVSPPQARTPCTNLSTNLRSNGIHKWSGDSRSDIWTKPPSSPCGMNCSIPKIYHILCIHRFPEYITFFAYIIIHRYNTSLSLSFSRIPPNAHECAW